jgi:hypothetical protein
MPRAPRAAPAPCRRQAGAPVGRSVIGELAAAADPDLALAGLARLLQAPAADVAGPEVGPGTGTGA